MTQAASALVEGNTIVGTADGTYGRSAAFGAWGYPDPTVWGHATFQGNTITGTRGISLWDAADVNVVNNTLEQNTNGVWIGATGYVTSYPTSADVASLAIHGNSFAGDTGDGVDNTLGSGDNVGATLNWWGCAAGPTKPGCAAVSSDVTFDPWLQGKGSFTDNGAWSTFNNATWTAGAGVGGSYGLVTTSTQTSSGVTYGGIALKKAPSNPADIWALSFDFNTNQTGQSGGSPRLVVMFSDGGNAQLRPITWTANTWAHLDGMSGTNWDNDGGCGYLYATTWQAVLACHPGATVSSIFVVNDSGWEYPTAGEQVSLDNVTVNQYVATGPGANQ
jgi:parallel beta-helix repeat protein